MKLLPMVPAPARAFAGGTLATATIDRIDDDGVVYVAIGDATPVPARIAAVPGATLVAGAAVLVLLEDGAPVIVAPVLDRLPVAPPVLELSATQQVVLRCGDASIAISADGTIELRGERIDSEAEGIQRIKGAQVRIN